MASIVGATQKSVDRDVLIMPCLTHSFMFEG